MKHLKIFEDFRDFHKQGRNLELRFDDYMENYQHDGRVDCKLMPTIDLFEDASSTVQYTLKSSFLLNSEFIENRIRSYDKNLNFRVYLISKYEEHIHIRLDQSTVLNFVKKNIECFLESENNQTILNLVIKTFPNELHEFRGHMKSKNFGL